MTRETLMLPPPHAVNVRYADKTPAPGDEVAVMSCDVVALEVEGWTRVQVNESTEVTSDGE